MEEKSLTFMEATEILFSKLYPQDLAEALGISVGAITKARQSANALSRQNPPRNWEPGVITLARRRIAELEELIEACESQDGLAQALATIDPSLSESDRERLAEVVRGMIKERKAKG